VTPDISRVKELKQALRDADFRVRERRPPPQPRTRGGGGADDADDDVVGNDADEPWASRQLVLTL